MISIIVFAVSGFGVSAICTWLWVEFLKDWYTDNGTPKEKFILNVGAVLIASIMPALIVVMPIVVSIFLKQDPQHPLFWETLWTSGTLFATELCILRYIERRIRKNTTTF